MARQQVRSPEIDGFRYVVTQLDARTGRRLAFDLASSVLPAMAELMSALPDAKPDKETLAKAIGNQGAVSAVQRLVAALPPSRLDEITELMAESTAVHGPGYGDAGAPLSRQFEDHFAGRYKAMLQWLAFALRVNFADFFGGTGGEVLRSPQSAARA